MSEGEAVEVGVGRYLSFAEREQLPLLRVQDHGVRECARGLGRSPSTIRVSYAAT